MSLQIDDFLPVLSKQGPGRDHGFVPAFALGHGSYGVA